MASATDSRDTLATEREPATAIALRRRKFPYRFPWRTGNRFRLLVDGDAFFSAMLAAVDGARRYVLLEMYLFESGPLADRFITALGAAAARGVAVQVLVDDFGARGLTTADRWRLTHQGAQFAVYNPLRLGELRRSLFRDHRKLLIVDGTRAFVGGAGITDAFAGGPSERAPWRETMVDISGPVVADWRAVFAETWARWSGTAAPTGPVPPPEPEDQLGRVALSLGVHHTEIKRSVLKHVRQAEHRVWLTTAYFVPSRRLRRALRRAARAGVDVRLLLPGPLTDHPGVRHAGRRFYGRLLHNRVRIFEYQPRFMHGKVLLCDQWVSIGSSNVDRWNLRWNLEANQEIDNAGFADQVAVMLERDFADCREILLTDWLRRPWYQRLAERLWGAVDTWLENRGAQRRR